MSLNKIVFIVFTAALVFCGCSQWAGKPVTKEFSVGNRYTELQVKNAFDIIVSDTVSNIIVSAGENVMPKVVVENNDGKLIIRCKDFNKCIGSDMKVILPYNPSLNKVCLSGASEYHSKFAIKSRNVEVDLSGASDFYCDIDAEEAELDLSGASSLYGNVSAKSLDVELSGASDATLTGCVESLNIDLSGASDLKNKLFDGRYALACRNCEGSISGSSDAFIHCDGIINVSLSGNSDLHYSGNAETHGCSTSGNSNVIHK